MSETKSIRVSAGVHRDLKIYAAQTDLNIVKVADQAIINFLREFPSSFIIHNTVSKKKSPKPKKSTK